jgi:DNA-binding NarL/FixJ family response regulator
MIHVLLAEDHHLVRDGIRALLEKADDIQVVGEVENGQDAVDFTLTNQPDVVVMDINMPQLNGVQAAEHIRTANLKTQVVILSMYSDETIIRQALRAGVKAYLLKRSLSEELPLAIRAVARGETYFSPGVSNVLLDTINEIKAEGNNINPIGKLTQRERQVMQLIAEGNTNKSIAEMMTVSEKTIEKHRGNLMAKLDLHDVAGVVRMAIKYKLIFIDE